MRLLASGCLALLILVSACRNTPSPDDLVQDITIQIEVEPAPPVVGEAMLLVTLTDADGQPVEDAAIHVRGDMQHAGMVPEFGDATRSDGGAYRVPFQWTMGGDWIVEVTASLPDDRGTAQRTFAFTVDTMPGTDSEMVDLEATAANEYRIVIPAGTGDMIAAGHHPGVIPDEILLKLRTQNTLTIVNQDKVDHTVGPFFIRAGESIRQVFSRPATFVGACSIHEGNQVRIVIEE